jgi:acyl-CoA thioesterase FadM
MNFAYTIIDQTGRLILEATTNHVCTSISEKPKRVPPQVVAKLAPFFNDSSETVPA